MKSGSPNEKAGAGPAPSGSTVYVAPLDAVADRVDFAPAPNWGQAGLTIRAGLAEIGF